MASSIDALLVSTAALFVCIQTARQLDAVARASRGEIDAWRREYLLRSCASGAAARRNLDAAATILGELNPDAATALAATAAALADDLVRPAPGAPAPDADGTCASSDGRIARLHFESNPDLPPVWPNWVYRLE
jgi:hypothetical protein